MKTHTILPVLILGLVTSVVGQSSVEKLQTYLENLEKNPYAIEPMEITSDNRNANKILDKLHEYAKHANLLVRSKTFGLVKMVGMHSEERQVRERSVEMLLEGLSDPDASIRNKAITGASAFARDDFSSAARRTVSESLKSRKPNLSAVIKLAGFLELYDVQGELNDLLKPETSVEIRWATRLALARMNDVAATNFIVNKINSIEVDDDFVDDILPDLIYTRNAAVFHFLETIAMSDERGCSSPNPNVSEKIPCAYAVMEAMAPLITDFPNVNSGGDPVKNLSKARAWLTRSTAYSISRTSF